MASNLHKEAIIASTDVKMIAEISEELGLQIPEKDHQDFVDLINEVLSSAKIIHEIPQPKPEVAYARMPGYRPDKAENPYNAWFVKTEIQGAAEGILRGKRIAIKDNVAVAGVPMMNGSTLLEGHVPDYDATIVTRILKAGGTIIGKAQCDNLCSSGSSFTPSSGPILNPLDTKRSAGGSSGGSGVLVAAGEVDMAIGGDQGGSIHYPSSWCGIVGLKPTFSLVPYTGAAGLYLRIDHLGPMAKNVKDCATLLQAIAGPDPLDPRQSPTLEVPDYLKELENGVDGIKIGILKEGFDHCEQEVQFIVMGAIGKLESAGCSTESVSVPYHKTLSSAIIGHVLFPGTAENMNNGGILPGTGGWHDVAYAKFFKLNLKSQAHELPLNLKYTLTLSEVLKKQDNFRTFAKAENLIPVFRKAYDDVLKTCDVLIMPSTPYPAPELPSENPLSAKEYMKHAIGMVANACPFNQTGHPALSVNAGFAEETGMPVGMMIVGRHFQDTTVLKVARAFEKARDGK